MAEPNAISSTPLTLHLTVSSASLICSNGWILPSKPDPYVKVVLRDKEMETNVAHKTLHPTWEKLFNLNISPCSKIHLKVMNKCQLRSDILMGQTDVDISYLLKLYNGKIQDLKLTLDLKNQIKGNIIKTGELTLTLGGVQIDMSANQHPDVYKRQI